MKISFLKKFNKNSSFIDKERLNNLKSFKEELGIRFRSSNLLNLALTHRSVVTQDRLYNNERLEFLGDSVLGIVVTEYLYKSFPENKEGDLAKIKSYVVSEEVLSKIAININLDKHILMGKGEEASGGRKKHAILEDSLEALFGAHYLDQGFIKSKTFILSLLVPEINKVINGNYRKDYKTIFQEIIQKNEKVCPKYKLIKKTGPDHETVFVYGVLVNGLLMGNGSGKSRKIAEQNAAKDALNKIS